MTNREKKRDASAAGFLGFSMWGRAGILVFVLLFAVACGEDEVGQNSENGETVNEETVNQERENQETQGGVLSTGEFEMPGTVTRLDVRGPGGERQESYGLGHPIEIEVDVAPSAGWENRLDDFMNVHVGLVERVETEEARGEAETCYLGALLRPGEDISVLEDGTVRYTRKYYISESCLDEEEDSGTFNVWVALNPARYLPDEEGEVVIGREKFNTQFFNPLFDDTTGEDRNGECVGANGVEGCIYDVVVERMPSINVSTVDTELQSDVFVFDPIMCDLPQDYGNPQAQTQTTVALSGYDESVDFSDHETDVFGELDVELPTLYFDICPQGDDGACAAGTSYLRMKVGSTNEAGENVLVNEVQVDELRAGVPHLESANLYLEMGGDVCMAMAGWNPPGEPDWSGERDFRLRVCSDTAFEETSPGGDPDGDDCVIRELQMVHVDDLPDGEITSEQEFVGGSDHELGNRIINAYAGFGSENVLNMEGARSDGYMRAGVDGWISFEIFDVGVSASSSIDGSDSGVESHLDLVGARKWSSTDEGDGALISDSVEFSERECLNYSYGIAGVGLDASLCGEGSVGMEVEAKTFVEESAGEEPFDQVSRYGGVEQAMTPYSGFALIASASVDVALARGGIEGTLDLITTELPVASALTWGVDDPVVVTTWDVSTDLELSFLSGHIDAFVDLARPGWCGYYPCRKWANVVDERLVSFAGIRSTYSLLEQSNPYGTSLLEE